MGQGRMASNWKREGQIRYQESLYCEGRETLEEGAQESHGCPFPGRVQGQAGEVSEKPDLVKSDPSHDRGLELDDP